MYDVVIYGCGGLGAETAQLIEDINSKCHRWNLLGFIDDCESNINKKIYKNYKVLGDAKYIKTNEIKNVVIAIANPIARQNIYFKLENICEFPNMIHPNASVKDQSSLKHGCIIFENSVVSVNTSIGSFTIINPMCGVGHDTTLGEYTTLMWNVMIAGNVKTGKGCSFGSSSVIIQGLTCGNNSYIGAGSTVVKNVEKDTVVVGTPAKFLKYNK